MSRLYLKGRSPAVCSGFEVCPSMSQCQSLAPSFSPCVGHVGVQQTGNDGRRYKSLFPLMMPSEYIPPSDISSCRLVAWAVGNPSAHYDSSMP